MTTKTNYALIALVAIAVVSFGFTPAFATTATNSVISNDVDEYDKDNGSLYVGDVCNRNNTHLYKHVATNWGSNDKVVSTFYTNNNSNCYGLDHVVIKIYVNGSYETEWETTSEAASHTFRDVDIPEQSNNSVESRFLVYY